MNMCQQIRLSLIKGTVDIYESLKLSLRTNTDYLTVASGKGTAFKYQKGKCFKFQIKSEVARKLNQLAKSENVSLFVFL